MHCPFCNHDDTKVTDSRLASEGHQIRRRRECLSCGERFTTFETAELVMPQVVKNDSTRQPFDEGKLRSGIMKALEKRPVSREAVEAAIERIGHRLRVLGERECPRHVAGGMRLHGRHGLSRTCEGNNDICPASGSLRRRLSSCSSSMRKESTSWNR